MPTSSISEFDPNADPGLQASLAELRQTVQAMEVELDGHRQAIETEAAVSQPAEATTSSNISPEQRGEFEQIEAQLGLPLVPGSVQVQPGFPVQEIMLGVQRAAQEVHADQHRSAATGKELQWFYVQDAKRVGPVSQSQLLELLEQGELQWDVLVWNKKLSDWIKASESELIDLSEGPAPPPIPSAMPAAKNETGKERKCNACGRVNAPDDRFCAACGKPLRSTRK